MPTSSAVNVATAIRTLLSIWTMSKIVGVIIILCIIASYSVFRSEPVAAISVVIGTIGFYWFSGVVTRSFMASTSFLRMVNAGIYGLTLPMIAELINSILLLLSIPRLKKRLSNTL